MSRQRLFALVGLFLLVAAVLCYRFFPRPKPKFDFMVNYYLIVDPVGPGDFLKEHTIRLITPKDSIELPAIFVAKYSLEDEPISLGGGGGPLDNKIDLGVVVATVQVEPPVQLRLAYDMPQWAADGNCLNLYQRLLVGPNDYMQTEQPFDYYAEQQLERRVNTETVIPIEDLK